MLKIPYIAFRILPGIALEDFSAEQKGPLLRAFNTYAYPSKVSANARIALLPTKFGGINPLPAK
jgi:hypothetical protein